MFHACEVLHALKHPGCSFPNSSYSYYNQFRAGETRSVHHYSQWGQTIDLHILTLFVSCSSRSVGPHYHIFTNSFPQYPVVFILFG